MDNTTARAQELIGRIESLTRTRASLGLVCHTALRKDIAALRALLTNDGQTNYCRECAAGPTDLQCMDRIITLTSLLSDCDSHRVHSHLVKLRDRIARASEPADAEGEGRR